MTRRIHFLLGRADAGAQSYITECLREHMRKLETAILIVPEQYTFETERRLSSALGGLFGVQVLSFGRLCERVLSLAGDTRQHLSKQGLAMVARRSVYRRQKELSAFSRVADKTGFSAEIADVVIHLKQCCILPEELQKTAEHMQGLPLLCDKLHDVALLYADIDEFLSARYLTADDAMQAVLSLLPASFVANVPVYIDGFGTASESAYRLAGAIFSAASEVTVSLTVDPDPAARDAGLFSPDGAILDALTGIAAKRGIPTGVRTFSSRPKHLDDALLHLERNLYAHPPAVFDGKTDRIRVVAAPDRAAEADALANAVRQTAVSGIRYRDMAVLVSDLDGYAELIRRAFSRRGIPVFIDRKRPVTAFSPVGFVLASLRAGVNGYPANELFSIAKSGFGGIAPQDAEAFENYARRWNLRGSRFLSPFTRGEPEDAERARSALVPKLSALHDALSEKAVSAKVRAVYAYLTAVDMQKTLSQLCETLLAAGRPQDAAAHAQIWNQLMLLLSQLDTILGDVSMGRNEFLAVFEEGLAGYSIGVVPGVTDQVLLGDMSRSRIGTVRRLFVVGANDGLLPPNAMDDALISDAELALLSSAGLQVWNDTAFTAALNRFRIYGALTKAREGLYVSFAASSDSNELSPSRLVLSIEQLFPGCARREILTEPDALPATDADAMDMLTGDLRRWKQDGIVTKRLSSLLSYYRDAPDCRARISRMLDAADGRMAYEPFGKKLADAIYGDRISMSASRLEQFSACPFRHFARYGMGAEVRKEGLERNSDLGSFYHAVLSDLVDTVTKRKLPWQSIDEETLERLLDELLPPHLAAHNDGILLSDERLRAGLFLIVETIRYAARAVVQQMLSGVFLPVSTEVRFGDGQAFPPIRILLSDGRTALLSGVIDRLDRAEIDGTSFFRIVDYKLSGKKLTAAGILAGLTLQLPLYLSAAAAGGERAGMYYMPLKLPALSEDAEVEAQLIRHFRMNGLTLSEPAVVAGSGGTDMLENVNHLQSGAFSGALCDSSELSCLLERAIQVTGQQIDRIRAGEMAASPIKGSCDYCDYRSVCRFDPTLAACRVRKLPTISWKTYFEELAGGHRTDAQD